MTELRQRMLDDLRLRNFSPHTQSAYISAVARFARHFGASPERLGPEEARQYLLLMVRQRHVAWSTYNITLCALRFFYQSTLGRAGLLDGIPCPKEPKRLPVVLSREGGLRLPLATRARNVGMQRLAPRILPRDTLATEPRPSSRPTSLSRCLPCLTRFWYLLCGTVRSSFQMEQVFLKRQRLRGGITICQTIGRTSSPHSC